MKRPTIKPWKPVRCACGARNPSFNRDGGKGPWRCGWCDATAEPMPKDNPFEQNTLL